MVYLAVVACGGAPALAETDALDRAISYHRDGQLPEALAAYREAIAATLAAEESDPERLGLAYHNACYVLIDLADPETAVDYCRAALDLRRDLADERGVARTLSNLGLALQTLGRFGEAEAAYRESLAINERRGDVAAEIRNRSNLGLLAMNAGRYGEAIDFHTSAEELAARHADEPWSRYQVRIARLNLGAVLEKLGAYREGLELLRTLAEEEDAEGSELGALVQVNLGVIYRNLGDPIRAVESFRGAAATYVRLGDKAGLSNAKLNLGLALHLNLRRLDEAERAYREALDFAREANDRTEEIQDLFYLGNLELELGRLDGAADSFRRCLELAWASESREGRWSGLYGLGRVSEIRGDPGGALELYRQAMAGIEEVRSGLAEASMRSGYFGDKRPIYAAAVRVLALLHAEEPGASHAGEALAIVQRAKARELLEALGAGRPAGSEIAADAFGDGLLGDDDVLLEYFQGQDELYLWVIRKHASLMFALGPSAPILEAVARVHEALSSGWPPPVTAVARLSRTLLVDGAALEGARTLRVAPDGQLYHLPFEILDDPGEPGSILLDRLEVSYLPSASTLAPLARRRHAPAEAAQLVGFANPDLPYDPEKPRAPGSLLVSRYGFGPLPAAELEVEAVRRILGGEALVRTGREATEEAFRELASRESRVMHLATHTVLDNRPGQKAVVLLAAGGRHDGVVFAEEIAALDYRARLTVLASCWSAMGNEEEGRALASLTNAFLAAGSSGVVATLWEVDDVRTAAFMEQFYYQLSLGLGAAEALRRAKLRLRATPGWDQPGLWSAYVLIGEGGSVVDRNPFVGSRIQVWTWIVAALLLSAGLWLALRR